MSDFENSYVGQLRKLVGSRLLLVPGARIVIEGPSQEVLLQKRTDFGLWGLPGGNAEEGEGLETAIIRETAEETGLHVFDVKPFGFGCDPDVETFTFPNGDRSQYFVLNFYTRSFTGLPKVSDDESTAVDWFPISRLPSMLPNMRRSVEAYARYLQTGQFQMI
jgi:ADP-ribose pyrophosphatase YjhB (NUDIX family)